MLMALLGALAGLGVVLFAVALRGAHRVDALPRVHKRTLGAQVEQFTLRLSLSVAAAVLIGALTRWPVAAVFAAVAAFLAPSLLTGKAQREAEIDRVEGIGAWAEMLRDTMAGAGGLEQSIIATAAVAPQPIRPQVMRLAARLERERLAPSLQAFADELDDPTGDLVVAALLLAADKSPKRLGALLGLLANSARDEVNMRLRVDTGRARTRTSAKVVTTSTVGFAVLLMIFSRDYMSAYDSGLGQFMLGVVCCCFAGSFWWIAKASRIDDKQRFLVTTVAR